MGQAVMCTRDKEFTIRGIGDRLARGYDRTGFFEVDTEGQRAWTVQLPESSEQSVQKPAPPGGRVSGTHLGVDLARFRCPAERRRSRCRRVAPAPRRAFRPRERERNEAATPHQGRCYARTSFFRSRHD